MSLLSSDHSFIDVGFTDWIAIKMESAVRSCVDKAGTVERLQRVKLFCLLYVVATTTAQLAFAQTENRNLEGQQVQLPNDVEQKASYCLAVLKLQYSEAAALESKVTDATNPDTRKALEAAALRFKKHAEKLNDNLKSYRVIPPPKITVPRANSNAHSILSWRSRYQKTAGRVTS